MARRAKVATLSEDSAPGAHPTEVATELGKVDKKARKENKEKEKKATKTKKDPIVEAKADSDEEAGSVKEKSEIKSISKKRKAPVDETSDHGAPASPQAAAGPALKKQKPKQKKNPKQSDEDDALFDLDLGINTIFARMDPDLLADYVAACTKRFGSDLSPIELSDLYVPAGAIRDTTTFADTRVTEKLPEFLESCVAGESEIEQKRLGSAPKEKGAPHTIVVAGAGLRAADLVRAARKFQKKDSLVAKLVSWHQSHP